MLNVTDKALWKAIALDRNNFDAYSWGLQMYQPKWGGDRTKLLKIVEMASANDERFAVLYEDVVDALRAVGDRGKADEMLEKAIALFKSRAQRDPRDAEAHYKLAFIAKSDSQRRYDDAIAEFQTFLKLKPRNAEVYYQLGWIYHYQKRQYSGVEKLYRQAIALCPTHDDAYNSLGNIHEFVKGDAAGAERLYRKAIALNPSEGFYHANLARWMVAQNRRNEAMAEAQKAIALGFEGPHPAFDQLGLNPQQQ